MNARLLTAIFGENSVGDTPEERARTSTKKWVRSTDQLAEWTSGATGIALTSEEAFQIFGILKLVEANDYGSAIITVSTEEPGCSFRKRRERMGLTIEEVAKRAGLTSEEVRLVEVTERRFPVEMLAHIARVLNIDPRRMCWERFD